MKRAPLVIAGTVAGLIGVLEFHTTPASLTLPGLKTGPVASAPAAGGSGGNSGTGASAAGSGNSGNSGGGGGSGSGGGGKASGASPAAGSGSQASSTRTAVGPNVNYYFGVLAVKVTVSSGKIVKIGIASLDDSGNPRSQMIDQQSIPILEQEALQAQGANIQSVSGASYTSAGFAQSLQSALHSLGF